MLNHSENGAVDILPLPFFVKVCCRILVETLILLQHPIIVIIVIIRVVAEDYADLLE